MFYQKPSKAIWVATVIIMVFGLVSLYSASYQNVRVSQRVFYDQMLCAVLGLFMMFLISRFDYRKFYDVSYVLYIIINLFLLILLFKGRHVLGAKRWIEFGGINFQPSELAKLTIILVLARYFSHRGKPVTLDAAIDAQILYRDLLIPLVITLIPTLLIFKQPDLGTALLLLGIFIVMLFVNGLPYKYFFGFLGLCLMGLPVLWQMMKEYQQQRLMVFLNPNIDPLGAGYTIIQSKIAMGSGRLFGKGWLSGTQNQLNFLPERHTDFIFSVVGEEWGLVGTFLLLGCFFALIAAGLAIAIKTKDKFGQMMAVGIVTIFTLQVIINIGMVLGLCPVVGLTLPLVSYGRSSFLIFVIMLGFLLNLDRRRTVF